MTKKNILFLLFGLILICAPAFSTPEDDFGYENWPGKNGVIRTNIEFPVSPFLGYGIIVENSNFPRYLWLDLKKTATLSNGEIKIFIFPTIEEAQKGLLEFLQHGFNGIIRPKQLLNSPIGDVVFGLDNEKSRSLFYIRANVMVQIVFIPITFAKAYDELPGKIDAIIQNAPIWKQGDQEPHLIISDEFKKAFQVSPR